MQPSPFVTSFFGPGGRISTLTGQLRAIAWPTNDSAAA
jgi:hypothetical protein